MNARDDYHWSKTLSQGGFSEMIFNVEGIAAGAFLIAGFALWPRRVVRPSPVEE